MKITMNHGSGGRETSLLIEEIFLNAFGYNAGNGTSDAAALNVSGKIAFTSDSFVVEPLFFNGGDIGRLAVCGTVNDLLTTGAVPKYLSASFILEEGLDTGILRKIAESMAETAKEAGVLIVTGDTKVVEEKGRGGLFISTSGIGEIKCEAITFASASVGDAIIITGNLGEHHTCITSARMGLQNEIKTDAAPLCAIVSRLLAASVPIHGMRDITRGGLATVLWEISKQHNIGAVIDENTLPVSEQVAGFCSILGLDPLYMGNEGNMLLIVPQEWSNEALELIRLSPYGQNAALIGTLNADKGVYMRTKIGGNRVINPLSGESLPRIC